MSLPNIITIYSKPHPFIPAAWWHARPASLLLDLQSQDLIPVPLYCSQSPLDPAQHEDYPANHFARIPINKIVHCTSLPHVIIVAGTKWLTLFHEFTKHNHYLLQASSLHPSSLVACQARLPVIRFAVPRLDPCSPVLFPISTGPSTARGLSCKSHCKDSSK